MDLGKSQVKVILKLLFFTIPVSLLLSGCPSTSITSKKVQLDPNIEKATFSIPIAFRRSTVELTAKFDVVKSVNIKVNQNKADEPIAGSEQYVLVPNLSKDAIAFSVSSIPDPTNLFNINLLDDENKLKKIDQLKFTLDDNGHLTSINGSNKGPNKVVTEKTLSTVFTIAKFATAIALMGKGDDVSPKKIEVMKEKFVLTKKIELGEFTEKGVREGLHWASVDLTTDLVREMEKLSVKLGVEETDKLKPSFDTLTLEMGSYVMLPAKESNTIPADKVIDGIPYQIPSQAVFNLSVGKESEVVRTKLGSYPIVELGGVGIVPMTFGGWDDLVLTMNFNSSGGIKDVEVKNPSNSKEVATLVDSSATTVAKEVEAIIETYETHKQEEASQEVEIESQNVTVKEAEMNINKKALEIQSAETQVEKDKLKYDLEILKAKLKLEELKLNTLKRGFQIK